jgi:hypothetical protein
MSVRKACVKKVKIVNQMGDLCDTWFLMNFIILFVYGKILEFVMKI